MTAALLTVGDELLIGQTVNGNAAWLGARLGELGVPVRESRVVGDDVDVAGRKPERIGHDLRGNGRVALTVRRAAQAQSDLAAGIHGNDGARTAAGLAVRAAAILRALSK